MSIYDAAMKYQQDGVPLVIVAGKEYGSGSSRDWAAKGVLLLGVRAVKADGTEVSFTAVVRVDTPQEVEYYRNGGILPYVLRQLAV